MTELSVFVALAITFCSCTKDKDTFCPPNGKQCDSTLYANPLPTDSCVIFPEISSGNLYISTRIGPGYALVGKSSINLDEWLYTFHPEGASSNIGAELWKVDTCSGKKQKLADNVYVQPKINQNGWILFMNNQDGLLYKINETGSNLSPVSSEINNITFDWCMNGEAFFYRARFKKVAYLVSVEGTVLDSFNLDCYAIAGRKNRIAMNLKSEISGAYSKIVILNLDNGYLTNIVELNGMGKGWPLALTWESDETIIGAFALGLFRIHVSTGEIETLEKTCDNLFYYYPNILPASPSWLAISRRDYTYPELSQVFFTTNMVLYNTQTGEEWKLDLDP